MEDDYTRKSTGVTPRLAWLNEFLGCVNRALMGQIQSMDIRFGADKIKAIVTMTLDEDLLGKNYRPFFTLANGFAKINDCVLEKMQKGHNSIIIDVLLKRRIGPPMYKNPLL